MKLRCRQC